MSAAEAPRFNPTDDALLIGAGFSFEAGMPLATELTADIRRNLTADLLERSRRLHDLNQPEHPITDRAFQALKDVLADPRLTYEDMAAQLLQPKYAHSRYPDPDLSMVAQTVMQAAEYILRHRTLHSEGPLGLTRKWYQPLASLAVTGRVDVYSLNHDLVLEHQLHAAGINADCGLHGDTFTVWNHERTKSLTLDLINRDEGGDIPLRFPAKGPGVNLSKLHGSLDLFAHGDLDNERTRSYVKIPTPGTQPFIDRYRWLMEDAQARMDSGEPLLATREHVVNGPTDIEFLRSSILTGPYKFSPEQPLYPLPEALRDMQVRLSAKTRLFAIGYSFGDEHINLILQSWATSTGGRIVAVGPTIQATDLPASLRDHTATWNVTATRAISDLAGRPWTFLDDFEHSALNRGRQRAAQIVEAQVPSHGGDKPAAQVSP